MIRAASRKPLFLHLETDREFRERLRREHSFSVSSLLTTGEIDEIAWKHCQVQRRLVEAEG